MHFQTCGDLPQFPSSFSEAVWGFSGGFFFFAALPTPTASLITGDYLCQSAQNIQKAVEMIQEAQKITPYIQNGYGAFLEIFPGLLL